MAIIEASCQIRVGYVDTDQMGIVHHSNYVRYFEVARCEFMRQCGLSYAEMERRGIMMPIVDVYSSYHSPAYYDDLLTIEVSLDEMPMARIKLHYKVLNESGKLLNTGYTTLGFMYSDSRRVTRVPSWFLEALQSRA